MLVATFGVSFLLQNVYLLAFGSRGSTVGTLGGLNTAIAVGALRISWITIVARSPAPVLLAVTAFSSTGRRSGCSSAPRRRTSAPRACSACARTA